MSNIIDLLNDYKLIINNPDNKKEKTNPKFNDDSSNYIILLYIYNLNSKKKFFNIDDNNLKNIILSILYENLSIDNKIKIINFILNNIQNYIHNDSPDINVEIKEFILELNKIISNDIIEINYNDRIIKSVVLPLKSDYKYSDNKDFIMFTLYTIELDDTNNYYLKKGEQTDYNKFYKSIIEKYNVDIKNYANSIGYVEYNSKNNYYNYKIKHFIYEKNEYSKGRLCNTFHTKQEKYDKFFKEIINQVEYDKLLKDIEKAKYLCIVCEIYFRYYDLIKKNNKKWFFNLNYSIINQFYK